MNGYHCYEQYNEPHEWFEIELLIQLLSILHWKKLGHSMSLICDPAHLIILEKYGIAQYYDEINYNSIQSLGKGINRTKYWAIAKILCNFLITDKEYAIIDTDVILSEMPDLKMDKPLSFTGMFCENHISGNGPMVYPQLEKVFNKHMVNQFKDYNDVMPVNTSFLHLRDRELVDEWTIVAYNTALKNSKKPILYGEMMTVEQRLLPMLARFMDKRYSTLVSNVYLPGKEVVQDGTEWAPLPQTGGNILDASRWYFHLWGFKKMLQNNKELRNNLISFLTNDLKQNFESTYNTIQPNFKIIK